MPWDTKCRDEAWLLLEMPMVDAILWLGGQGQHCHFCHLVELRFFEPLGRCGRRVWRRRKICRHQLILHLSSSSARWSGLKEIGIMGIYLRNTSRNNQRYFVINNYGFIPYSHCMLKRFRFRFYSILVTKLQGFIQKTNLCLMVGMKYFLTQTVMLL